MDIEQFSNLLLFREYDSVEKILKEGFDPNTPLEHDKPGIEWSSYTDDFRMIEILWKAGAKPTTPYVEEIIREFEKGKTYLDLIPPEENINDYPNITEYFSVNKFEFTTGELKKEEDGYYLRIPISKFVLDNEIVNTLVCLDRILLDEDINSLIGKTIKFPVNPDEGYIDGSVYLRYIHNPVDVREIKFISKKDDLITAEIDMDFIFEFENTGFPNERIKKTITFANII